MLSIKQIKNLFKTQPWSALNHLTELRTSQDATVQKKIYFEMYTPEDSMH